MRPYVICFSFIVGGLLLANYSESNKFWREGVPGFISLGFGVSQTTLFLKEHGKRKSGGYHRR